MNKKAVVGGILLVVAAVGAWYISIPFVGPGKYAPAITPSPTQMPQSMKLTSSAFANEEKIPKDFTCDGRKVNPPLIISGIPPGTKSLAIIVDDPDAPAGTFTHWVIWNIDPGTQEIQSGQIPPKSEEGTNSAGRIGYTPPCPPSGSHRYFFTLFAVDTTIGLDGKAKKADLEAQMHGHIIEQTNLIGAYGR